MNALDPIMAAFMQAQIGNAYINRGAKHGRNIKISRPFGNSKKSQRYRDWQMSARQGNEIAYRRKCAALGVRP